jgi:hypothetical protein
VKLSGSKEPFIPVFNSDTLKRTTDGFHETNQQFHRMSLDQFKDLMEFNAVFNGVSFKYQFNIMNSSYSQLNYPRVVRSVSLAI